MEKLLKSFVFTMMGATLLVGCSKDNDSQSQKPVQVTQGLFIVGSGNSRAGIDGNLSYIDYQKGSVVTNAFAAANGKSVGKTANYVTIYGSKLYIVVDAEATIWVCNKNTLKVERQLSTLTLLGATDGLSPRAAVGHDGKLYFTCYGASTNGGNGLVAAIDTVNFAKTATYTVGSYPDGLTVANGNLYVANSDYAYNKKASLSKINLASGAVTDIKDAAVTNPMHLVTVAGEAYYLDYGTYDESWNQTGAGVRKIGADGTVTKVVDGTAMCTDGTKIYTVNAPFGAAQTTYYIYDPATAKTTSWTPSDVFSPAMIAADPVSGNVFIVSYQKDPDTGYPAYALPSYTNQYDATGKFVKRFDNTATGAISAAFNTK